MEITLRPLPVKMRISFDIPKLLQIINEEGEYATDTKFEDLLVIRNYMRRHNIAATLSQRKVPGGYVLSLRPRAT